MLLTVNIIPVTEHAREIKSWDISWQHYLLAMIIIREPSAMIPSGILDLLISSREMVFYIGESRTWVLLPITLFYLEM